MAVLRNSVILFFSISHMDNFKSCIVIFFSSTRRDDGTGHSIFPLHKKVYNWGDPKLCIYYMYVYVKETFIEMLCL
jgi:hypothetical protein